MTPGASPIRGRDKTMMTNPIWIAGVLRVLPGAAGRLGDRAVIYQQPLDEDPLEITNELRHRPPVENNVSYYGGTFASYEDAERAVRASFPDAEIR